MLKNKNEIKNKTNQKLKQHEAVFTDRYGKITITNMTFWQNDKCTFFCKCLKMKCNNYNILLN